MPNGNKCSICMQEAIIGTLCKEHFLESIEEKIKKTIIDFRMFSKDDRVLVAYSGGKDSTVLLYILNKLGFHVEALTLNAYIGCYSRENLHNAIAFCREHSIKLHHISFREEFGYSLCYLRSVLQERGINLKSCTICGVLRRYLINRHARELGSTKIAFGHNLDDEAQAILMNLFKGTLELLARTGPITDFINEKFVQRVKPLYFVSESEVIAYSKIKEFKVHYNHCPCSIDSYRYSIRGLIKNLEKNYPDAKKNIVRSFLQLTPLLKKFFKPGGPRKCLRCTEPSSHDICRACSIIMSIHPPT